MRAEVQAWAEAVLGAAITDVVELSGGITSTMLALSDASGQQAVLRLLTKEPWRTHGLELTRRERAALQELATTPVPAPRSIGLDAEGAVAGVAMHLMSRLPGVPTTGAGEGAGAGAVMAEMLAPIHDVRPAEPFRTYQSWAREEKWVMPGWAAHPDSCQRAFGVLAEEPRRTGPPSCTATSATATCYGAPARSPESSTGWRGRMACLARRRACRDQPRDGVRPRAGHSVPRGLRRAHDRATAGLLAGHGRRRVPGTTGPGTTVRVASPTATPRRLGTPPAHAEPLLTEADLRTNTSAPGRAGETVVRGGWG